ncbi:MAG: type II secretion system protein [Candidatus Yonathbacteria bacterium]|nr:type II secretion system protein [Candidatus Yonathbacteria bacterium]
MNTKTQKKLGFTLIELLVVIAIIGVLSGVLLQSIESARAKSRDAARISTVDQINKALEISATEDTYSFPSTAGDYSCLGLSADSTPTCSPSGVFTLNVAINTALQRNLAGNIPLDPKFQNGIGAAYIYNSWLTPNGLPNGAYLSWVTEGTTCGRGANSSPVTNVTNGRQCFLRIGNSI